MKLLSILLLGAALTGATPLFAGNWKVKANYAESCACNVVCPCLFGGAPTRGECVGQGLFKITEGSYDGVDLAGVEVFVAFKMGVWEKYTVSETASDAQFKAIREVLEKAYIGENVEVVGFDKGPVSMVKTGSTIRFRSPDGMVEMVAVEGSDGKPIRIDNLPNFPGYEQYRSVENKHESSQATFDMKGTNALTAKMVFEPKS